jgi:hypothetical protein
MHLRMRLRLYLELSRRGVMNFKYFSSLVIPSIYICIWRAVAWWLRHYATYRQVAGSIPDGVIGVFH